MAIDKAGYVAGATWVQNARNGGGTYDPEGFGYPWRIVLHTIQGSANVRLIEGHHAPPHLWYNPATRQLWQTVPLSRSSFAMWQGNGHYTNKARAIQIELHGYSEDAESWPQEWLDNITVDLIVPICRWVAAYAGGMIDLSQAPDPGIIANSSLETAPQRMSERVWANFPGLCSHRHVPQNGDRWDTGRLDTPRIARHAAMIIGGLLDTQSGRTSQEDEVTRAYVAPNDALVLVTGNTYKAIHGQWPQVHQGLVDLEASGVITKHADGTLWKPISSTALALLKAI